MKFKKNDLEKEEERLIKKYGSQIIAKAILDPFSYAAKLMDGEIILFHKACECTKKTITLYLLIPKESFSADLRYFLR